MSIFRSKYFLWCILALPSIPMTILLIQGGEAIAELLHVSGEFAARMMIIAMIATPLQMIFSKRRWPLWLVRNRRYFGVAAFAYAAVHTLAYIIDMNSLKDMLAEFWALGIWTGWAAFVIFIPLAVTSNDASQRAMRLWWKPLQRWVYPAAVLTLIHWIFVHNELGGALVHFIPLAALEGYRIYTNWQRGLYSAAQA